MNYEDLLLFLELDEAEEFQFFENLADLIECEEEIPHNVFFKLINQVDFNILSELIVTYFDEIAENLPDDAIDIYTLISSIKMSLSGMAKTMVEENDVVLFIDELDRFRKWYTFEECVICKNKSTGKVKSVPLLEAVTIYRLEQLDGAEHDYDFTDAVDYPIEEYVMSFGDILRAEDENDGEEDENCRHHNSKELDSSQLEDGYVYDDELSDIDELGDIEY